MMNRLKLSQKIDDFLTFEEYIHFEQEWAGISRPSIEYLLRANDLYGAIQLYIWAQTRQLKGDDLFDLFKDVFDSDSFVSDVIHYTGYDSDDEDFLDSCDERTISELTAILSKVEMTVNQRIEIKKLFGALVEKESEYRDQDALDTARSRGYSQGEVKGLQAGRAELQVKIDQLVLTHSKELEVRRDEAEEIRQLSEERADKLRATNKSMAKALRMREFGTQRVIRPQRKQRYMKVDENEQALIEQQRRLDKSTELANVRKPRKPRRRKKVDDD